MEMHEQDVEHLISVIAEGNPKPILLLGAGASVKSGIPATGPFVEKAAAWVYARRNQLEYDDVRIRRSDWLTFLESKQWFNSSKSLSENYPSVFRHLLTPREIRRQFYRLILNPKVDPSKGYYALNELVVNKYFTTILTTNFDNILYKVFSGDSRNHSVDVIKSLSDYAKISTDPKNIQIIHLHGDVDNYTDKNDIDEIESLSKDFIQRILPLLSDHPLIVVGYRGFENSIMRTLFIDNVEYTTKYKHGIYWCVLEQDNLEEVPENLKALHAAIDTNLQFVRIKGFDDLFEYKISKGIKPTYKISYTKENGNLDGVFDLRIVIGANLGNLDQILLRQRISQYCKTLKINLPNDLSEDSLNDVLTDRDLIAEVNGRVHPTNSGLLLFGKNPVEFLPNSTIKLVIQDYNDFFKENFLEPGEEFEKEQIISGNLWSQLNSIIDIVSQFNKQFKLKSEQSTTVTPYPPLAIKELLTNCIVHRNYEDPKETTIEISPRYIRIINSGGLVEDVQDKLEGEEIEDVIKKGTKGIKGYRNPVLADLFYGTETMEKRGSGLADVFEETIRYASQVKFGPVDENKNFEAIIYSRPELVDEITNTAKQKVEYLQKYSSNIVELVSIPKYVYLSDCTSSAIDIVEELPFETHPPFIIYNKKLITFIDPSNSQFGFQNYIDMGTIEALTIEEFTSSVDTERQFVDLLNRAIVTHLQYLGLRVDKIKRRAFFERSIKDENNIQIRYQARVKSATRTVVKKRVSQNNKVLYWEHKSFSFKVEKFQDSYSVIVIPNYTFTIDGFSKYIKAEKINALSTKRASRDYNIHYLNDLSFWIWIITKGGTQNAALNTFPDKVEKSISDDQKVYINNEYVKATTISEELFDDVLNEEFYADSDDLYDEVDKIAFTDLEENTSDEENQIENDGN